MRMPPDLNGHGGSQRAWHLVEALRPLGDVHFVLLYRDHDHDCVTTSLEPLAARVKTLTRIEIPGWRGFKGRQLGIFHPGLRELFKMRSHEAPHFSSRQLAEIASRLPLRQADVIFAGRLCSAVIAQALMDKGHLSGNVLAADFDDLMSKFRALQIRNAGASLGRQGRLLARLDTRLIARAERHIARKWGAIGVCTEEDKAALRAAAPATPVVKIANIVDRALLPPRAPNGNFNILFIGNLGFSPNSSGLTAFLEQAWPVLRAREKRAALVVVGINPPPALKHALAQAGIPLHANVPSVKPFYAACDAVIAPILFGSGTRIKILEAMAYGRPVVSTRIGADGLGLRDGEEILLADDMAEFAGALARLAREPALARQIAAQARAYQERNFGPRVIMDAVRDLLHEAGHARQTLRASTGPGGAG